MQLVPAQEALPAPSIIFHVLNVAMFVLHILLVNTILGAGFYLLVRHFTRHVDEPSDRIADADSLRHAVPVIMAFTINLGIPALLFLQVVWGQFFYTSSVLMAVAWILVIPVLLLTYYSAYINVKTGDNHRYTGLILTIFCMGLIFVSMVFVNNMTFMLQPEKWTAYFTRRGGTLLNFSDKTFIPRWLHVICAASATSGFIIAFPAWLRNRRDNSGSLTIKKGLRIYSAATLVQMPAGIWFLLSLPGDFTSRFMGGNPLYTAVLYSGILFALTSIITSFLGRFTVTIVLFLLTVIAMGITRDNLRSLYLQPYFSAGNMTVSPQYGMLIMFILVLAAGICAIVWMVRHSMSGTKGGVK